MARELVEKDVDGRLYSFEQLTATVALKTLTKLTKIFGEPLTLALGGFFKKAQPGAPTALLESDIDSDVLSKAMKVLVERMDEDEVVALIKLLTTQGVLCDGVKVASFDEHFRGELSHLFAVLKAALEVQYGNFIGAVTDRLPSASSLRKSTTVGNVARN